MPDTLRFVRSFIISGEIQDSLYWTPPHTTLASVGYGALPPGVVLKLNDFWSGLSQTNDNVANRLVSPKD